jgi:hypothetical protein
MFLAAGRRLAGLLAVADPIKDSTPRSDARTLQAGPAHRHGDRRRTQPPRKAVARKARHR